MKKPKPDDVLTKTAPLRTDNPPADRKRVFSTDEVPHYWAANNREDGRGGRVFFDRGVIYSYGWHFPMARHVQRAGVGTFVLLTTRKYSSSTARHVSSTERAVRHLTVYRVADVRADTRKEHLANLYAIRDEAKELLEKAQKARQRRREYVSRANGLIHNANQYAAAVGLDEWFEEPKDEAWTQWLEKVRKEKEAESVAAAEIYRKIKARQERKAKEAVKKWEAELKEWQGGGPKYPDGYSHYSDYRVGRDYLRVREVDGVKYIQTTQKVSVKLEAALPILRLVRAGRKYDRVTNGDYLVKVEDFELREIDPVTRVVLVGCHTISFDEILRLAEKEGL